MIKRIRIWKERHYTGRGYLYIKGNNPCIKGVVGTDIKLTTMQKIQILFSKGVSVSLHESNLN